jgi:acid phosphatase (class A)
MIPEKRLELHERNREYGQNRVMIGEHFPRDISGGEITATVIVHALMGVPAFRADFQAARTELRQVLGDPPQAEVVGTIKPN